MIDEARWAFIGNYFDWLYISCLLLGLLFLKGKKKLLIIPAIMITLVIVNPVTYDLWYKFNDRAYWRLIWIVPVVVVCAAVPSFFVDKSKSGWLKIGTLVLAIATFMICGSLVYAHENTTFKESNNADKLPDDVVNVAEALLEINEHPYVVADASISTYIRQYSGKIKTLYTRDVSYGVAITPLASEVYEALTNGNFEIVAQRMIENIYEYLVTYNEDDVKATEIEKAGFKFLGQVGPYGIYEVNGDGKKIRVYDELQRVARIEIVDKHGKPMNGQDGYATHAYEYDDLNRVIREVYLDAKNNPVNTAAGYSEIYYDYADGKLSLTYFTNTDGKLVRNGSAFFHEYLLHLKSMLDRGDSIAIFFSIRDEGANALTETLQKDLNRLGLRTELIGKTRSSYCAVVTRNIVEEAFDNDREVSLEGIIGDNTYFIISAGYMAGDKSSIMINEYDHSWNSRGMNIVIYDLSEQKVVQSVSFDTHATDMSVLGNVSLGN